MWVDGLVGWLLLVGWAAFRGSIEKLLVNVGMTWKLYINLKI